MNMDALMARPGYHGRGAGAGAGAGARPRTQAEDYRDRILDGLEIQTRTPVQLMRALRKGQLKPQHIQPPHLAVKIRVQHQGTRHVLTLLQACARYNSIPGVNRCLSLGAAWARGDARHIVAGGSVRILKAFRRKFPDLDYESLLDLATCLGYRNMCAYLLQSYLSDQLREESYGDPWEEESCSEMSCVSMSPPLSDATWRQLLLNAVTGDDAFREIVAMLLDAHEYNDHDLRLAIRIAIQTNNLPMVQEIWEDGGLTCTSKCAQWAWVSGAKEVHAFFKQLLPCALSRRVV